MNAAHAALPLATRCRAGATISLPHTATLWRNDTVQILHREVPRVSHRAAVAQRCCRGLQKPRRGAPHSTSTNFPPLPCRLGPPCHCLERNRSAKDSMEGVSSSPQLHAMLQHVAACCATQSKRVHALAGGLPSAPAVHLSQAVRTAHGSAMAALTGTLSDVLALDVEEVSAWLHAVD